MDKKTLLWIERLVWILIFGGMLVASLGLFLRLGSDAGGHLTGTVLIVKGGVAIAAGVVLIFVRARWP